jgi:hypothetical protein
MTETELLKIHQAQRTRCTVYTRVMGYHRPVEAFNIGKKGEFRERKHFTENKCQLG